jgi:Tubulin-tyrosine ligase family
MREGKRGGEREEREKRERREREEEERGERGERERGEREKREEKKSKLFTCTPYFSKYSQKEKHQVAKRKGKEANRVPVGPWIVKPHDAAGGYGIIMVQRLADLGYLEIVQMLSRWKKIVVSQYVMFLFFHFRIFVFSYFRL